MTSNPLLQLHDKLARINLFLCDVDGVLTNGNVVIGQDTEYKQFNIHDGLGLRLLQKYDIKVGWISNRPSSATRQRAQELQIDFLHQAQGSKVKAVESILSQADESWENVSYIGDDLVDLGVLKRAGFGAAVANAIPEVRAQADYITQHKGGQGAVREVVEMILKAKNLWADLIKDYSL